MLAIMPPPIGGLLGMVRPNSGCDDAPFAGGWPAKPQRLAWPVESLVVELGKVPIAIGPPDLDGRDAILMRAVNGRHIAQAAITEVTAVIDAHNVGTSEKAADNSPTVALAL